MGDFSETRVWWPSCLLDEIMPDGRNQPQDWLAPDAMGATVVRWDDHDPDSDVAAIVAPDDIVAFVWRESRGRAEIIIFADGSWCNFNGSQAIGGIDATQFYDASDFDMSGDSIDEFTRNYADCSGPLPPDGETVTVVMARWSDEVLFQISADGKSLTPVEQANG